VAAAVLGVAVLAAGFEGLPLLRWPHAEKPYEPWQNLQTLRSMLPLSPAQRDYIGPTFSRDRDYAVFLHGVEKLAPEGSRFFLHVSDSDDWYRYRAAYRLAPTPVELWRGQGAKEDGKRQLLLIWQHELPPGWQLLSEVNDGMVATRIPSAGAAP
jgi:hypothetical protein